MDRVVVVVVVRGGWVRCRDDNVGDTNDPRRAVPKEDRGCCSLEEPPAFADCPDVVDPNEKAATPSKRHEIPRSNKD